MINARVTATVPTIKVGNVGSNTTIQGNLTSEEMALSVRVFANTSPSVQVTNISGGGIQASNPTIVAANLGPIASGGGGGGTATRFDELLDVIETGLPTTGSVPVYDPVNDKYEVKPLDFDHIAGDINDLDGGTF